MQRAEDFARDIAGGVTGKILHLTVDSWIEAPTREQYEASYFSYDGYLERGLVAAARVLSIADNPVNRTRVVRSKQDLAAASDAGMLAIVMGNEGGKVVGRDPALVDAWQRIGLRHIQLNWAMRNLLGASQSNESEVDRPGLTELGRAVVRRMNELGMIVDVSHSSPRTIADVIAVSERPVLNSHSGSRLLADKPQNLWDDQIRAMAACGGVIGIHFCSRLVLGANDKQADKADLVRQVRYVANTGGIDVVGLGPDWVLGDPERDRNYLRNTSQQDITWTRGFEDSGTASNLIPLLEHEDFTPVEIEKIVGGNLLRLFNDVLPE